MQSYVKNDPIRTSTGGQNGLPEGLRSGSAINGVIFRNSQHIPCENIYFAPLAASKWVFFFAPGPLWEGACNSPRQNTAPSALLGLEMLQKGVPKTILKGMIFHQTSSPELVKSAFSHGRCCEFRVFAKR